jgi:hypothetical protein
MESWSFPLLINVKSLGELLPLKFSLRNSYPPALFLKPITVCFLPYKRKSTSRQKRSAISRGIHLFLRYSKSGFEEIGRSPTIRILPSRLSFFSPAENVSRSAAGERKKNFDLAVRPVGAGNQKQNSCNSRFRNQSDHHLVLYHDRKKHSAFYSL